MLVKQHYSTPAFTIPPSLTLLDKTKLVEMDITGSVDTLRD